MNATDADGLLTIFVPGTSLLPWGRANGTYAAPDTPFNAAMANYFGEDVYVLEWRGQTYERESAMQSLLNAVRSHDFAEGERLNIVAHSHGGNIVKDYTWQEGARKIDTLITLGTPQRWDYRIKGSMVGTYLNVYSKYDTIQKFGGYSPWSGIGGAIIGGIVFGPPGGLFGAKSGALIGGLLGLFVGKAGRTDRCAVNIGIDRATGVGRVDHGDLHTVAVWNAMEAWLIRANHGLHPTDLSYCSGGLPTQSDWLSDKYNDPRYFAEPLVP